MAPNFCTRCGVKVVPERKFCPDCEVLLTTTSINTVTKDSVQLSIAPSSTAQPRAHTEVLVLGTIGSVLGVIIGILLLVGSLFAAQAYYAGPGPYIKDVQSQILVTLLTGFGILIFSIIGALGAAQKLNVRSTVNAGGLFVVGVAVLLSMLGFGITIVTASPNALSGILVFVLAALIDCFWFCLSGYLLLREPAS